MMGWSRNEPETGKAQSSSKKSRKICRRECRLNNSPAGNCRNMGGALSDGVCSTVQSRGPAENLLFSITTWLTAGEDRHYYAAAVSA